MNNSKLSNTEKGMFMDLYELTLPTLDASKDLENEKLADKLSDTLRGIFGEDYAKHKSRIFLDLDNYHNNPVDFILDRIGFEYNINNTNITINLNKPTKTNNILMTIL